MKTKFLLFGLVLFIASSTSFAQKNNDGQSIISEKVAIKKYHNKEELERMPKGQLLTLYVERIESLIKTLPYIAFATKPGVTMTSLGIPDDKANKKMLESQFEATDDFIKANSEFQKTILPYSDTSNLIAAILFYEEIMKSLHEFSEFH